MIAAREEKSVTPAHVLSTALEAARCAPATHLPHEQAEIEGARVDQEPFENVAMPAQMCAAHAAGVVDMGERPFQVLATSAQQPLATPGAQPPAIGVDRLCCASGAWVHWRRPRSGSAT